MKYKTKTLISWLLLLAIVIQSCRQRDNQRLTILETTDLHGVILPYDYIEKENLKVSMAGVSSYINKLKEENKSIILLDNGDNLQGQPEVYYYNFIDTAAPHFNAEAMNYLQYDAGTVGNHDIEAGHSVYDRVAKEYKFPLLAANAVVIATGKPYFKPYTIIERNRLRVAVLGLITPAVPTWLPSRFYSGIEFRDMVETAKEWMPVILKEKPDVVVGLFHSGWDGADNGSRNNYPQDENASSSVATNVPGFDIIFTGHDHRVANEKIVNIAGDTVLVIDGGSKSDKIGQADIIFYSDKSGRSRPFYLKGKIVDVENYEPDPVFVEKFAAQDKIIREYVDKVIATSEATFSSRDSYFGSSAFVDMIHRVQLDITHADISFAAPLSFDVRISSGKVSVSDMFKLYRFENMLYSMILSGDEIRKYLEYSYSEWLSTMNGPGDMLLCYKLNKDGRPLLTNGRAWLKNQPYNFDSAAGIDYIVDVSKPNGQRVTIKSLSNGQPFEPAKNYTVAVNSYRGTGGGGHLTEGAGIAKEELVKRIATSTDRDLRYFILRYLEDQKEIKPAPLNNWKIVPEEWVAKAKEREYKLLFGDK